MGASAAEREASEDPLEAVEVDYFDLFKPKSETRSTKQIRMALLLPARIGRNFLDLGWK